MDSRYLPLPGPGPGAHPGFGPYAALRADLLRLPREGRLAQCNALARERGLTSAAGVPLRFIDAGCPGDALGYEAAILREGRIAWRRDHKGAMHDLHNALAWLTFPRIKAMLNRLHLTDTAPRSGESAASPPAVAGAGRRSRRRDLLTLLDESGLLWLSASPQLDHELRRKHWHSLLVARREEIRARVQPIVIGHGLLEKLAVPYKSMTAHCLVMSWDRSTPAGAGRTPAASSQTPAASGEAGAAFERAAIDGAVAAYLQEAFGSHALPVLAPLPILGLPGWDPANLHASYYDDARVFRTQ
ncbi:MAG: DUF3025 domain-containing protein [Lautropia sp.]